MHTVYTYNIMLTYYVALEQLVRFVGSGLHVAMFKKSGRPVKSSWTTLIVRCYIHKNDVLHLWQLTKNCLALKITHKH